MNGSKPVGELWQTTLEKLTNVRQSRFFRDRISVALIAAALLLNGLNLISLALTLRPTDAQVPVRFSSLTLFDALGPWYYPFLIVLFAVVVTISNSYFAYTSFSRSRIASFYLLAGADVVAIFSLIVSSAFGVVR
jgi:hypothetical protein